MQAMSPDTKRLMRAQIIRGEVTPVIALAMLNAVAREHRDAWVDQLWGIEDVPADDPNLPRGCVPYLPCAATTVLTAVQQARITSTDVFVDIGSGTGRTMFLAHMLTAASCIGVEIQPALVKLASTRASSLNLSGMRFIEGDALDRVSFITTGTVFFLYCPFSGCRLDSCLDLLEGVARSRRIRVCCVHMPPLERTWLALMPSNSADLHVYESTFFGD